MSFVIAGQRPCAFGCSSEGDRKKGRATIGGVIGALEQVLEAARALSVADQDVLMARLLEWQAEAERGDVPVWVCEEELALVRQGLAQADRGETVDARELLQQLRRGE